MFKVRKPPAPASVKAPVNKKLNHSKNPNRSPKKTPRNNPKSATTPANTVVKKRTKMDILHHEILMGAASRLFAGFGKKDTKTIHLPMIASKE
jgi:hypothetical protein